MLISKVGDTKYLLKVRRTFGSPDNCPRILHRALIFFFFAEIFVFLSLFLSSLVLTSHLTAFLLEWEVKGFINFFFKASAFGKAENHTVSRFMFPVEMSLFP